MSNINLPKPSLLYLGAPYSSKDRATLLLRVHLINVATAKLMQQGYFVFSPISHTHPVKESTNELGGDWEFWSNYDYKMLSCCSHLIVLTLANWKQSVGLKAEVQFALETTIPIYQLDPADYTFKPFVTPLEWVTCQQT